jgi:hypothetical protein
VGFFKSEISKIFTAILSTQAPATPKSETGGANSSASEKQRRAPSRAPVMSAYETVPAGRSFWDSPANDVRAWAEDVIRNQDAGDAHSLGSLADRLSTPDLAKLLKEVRLVREQNQDAQAKFTADVLRADGIRAKRHGSDATGDDEAGYLHKTKEALGRVEFFLNDLRARRGLPPKSLTGELEASAAQRREQTADEKFEAKLSKLGAELKAERPTGNGRSRPRDFKPA